MSLTVKVARSRVAGRGMPGVGDPGLFGTLGSILGGATGILGKILPGPIGAAARAVSRLLPTARQRTSGPSMAPVRRAPFAPFAPAAMPQMQQPVPGITGFLQRGFPGGETGMMDAPPIGAPSGYHVNETAYFLKDGTYVPEQSRWVKNRRRNPLNPRAASKAIGRIEALKRATARFSRITIRKKCCHEHGGRKKKK